MLKRLLIVPDLHCPFHDQKAWRLMMKAAKAFKPDTIVSIGDFCDFYSVSSHSKDPSRAFRLPQELAAANRLLDDLDSLGATRKIFIEGNHESRLHRYLCDKAPELFGLVTVPQLFKLGPRNWEHVPYKDHIKIGKLYFTHDVGKAGRYATFQTLDTYGHSVVTGHSHRFCTVVEGDALGKHRISTNLGWLGDSRAADYMARVSALKNWPLGFGTGYLDTKTGYAYLTSIPIVNYTCVVEGILYHA